MKILRIAFVGILFVAIMPSAKAAPIYAFPIVGCKVTYAHVHHDYPATDILTKAGCKFVAVTSGVVDEVRRVDQWSGKTNLPLDRGGLWVSIIGDDGVRYYGSHLKKVQDGIEPGVRVNAGDLLGLVGATGDARGTAPHVHFGISWPTAADIWWVRRGMLYPWKYLDAWKIGKDLSPAKSLAVVHAKVGDVPPLPKK
jgi:murein DD-endopeptidase MepM/ murein hydrolase activator NlpD